ncbi:MAG TPA: hypothetical protein VM577_08230 [Anaerovoracaceae bacterium]|nr:hypothetical protein [Anaerovoracaceae bacterium]
MSCAFGEIIFGWAWNSDVEEAVRHLKREELEDLGIWLNDDQETWKCSSDDVTALGFETFYSASGDDISGYLGVKLDDVHVYFPTLLSEFNTEPSEEQREQVDAKRKSLPRSLQVALGKPKVWIVWGDT